MTEAEGKRKGENEDGGVPKVPRVVRTEVAPLTSEDGRYMYELGQHLTSRYTILAKLGEGTWGDVIECWDDVEKECVAIKILMKTGSSSTTQHEVAVLEKLAESGEARSLCVQFRHWFQYSSHDCIVFEKLGPSLRVFLQRNKYRPIPVDLVRKFGRQLLEVVASMHDMTIIHTALTPESLFLVSAETVEFPALQFRCWPKSSAIKLIDFGSCISDRHRIQVKHHNRDVTTRFYRAPEVILGLDWTYPIDLWSVGCILAELCTGQILFGAYLDLNLEHLATLEKVLRRLLPVHMAQGASQENKKHFGAGYILNWPQGASSEETMSYVNKHQSLEALVSRHVESSKGPVLMDLLNGLLRYDPSKRLTARQALEHQFFKNPPP